MFLIVCLHKKLHKFCFCVHYILNFVQENVKNCTRIYANFTFCFRVSFILLRPWPLARPPFRKFLIHQNHHLWTPFIVKTWIRVCHGSVSNVWVWPWFRPGPCWGANSAPPEPIAGFTGPTSDWIQACLLLKIMFSHSGKLTGTATTTA